MISVCIPAYKNADFLQRNLDALCGQTFTDFEVIVSDDSPDDTVALLVQQYGEKLQLVYFKNNPPKGTPANWNLAMAYAKGQYIQLIHDDDWLAAPDALQQYHDAMEANPDVDFCFSAYYNVHLDTGKKEPVFCNGFNRYLLRRSPYNLFRKNFIGPPSTVFIRNNQAFYYDEHLKWLVDFEGYIRHLAANGRFIYIDKCLANIGLGSLQVTQYTRQVKEVVIPESMYFLQKHKTSILNNIWVYDYYWRMCRNLAVKKIEDIGAAGWEEEIPAAISRMIVFQAKIPTAILKTGPLSKLLMLLSYGIQR